MTEPTSASVPPKNAGAKPRLSLLSSRQSCTRLKSEDYPPEQAGLHLPIGLDDDAQQSNGFTDWALDTNLEDVDLDTEVVGRLETNFKPSVQIETAQDQLHLPNSTLTLDGGERDQSAVTRNDQQQQGGLDKLSVSKEDLIALLSVLKSELQSKEIALASIKLEQLKRLINPVEISRSSLATTYIELQDRLKAKEKLHQGDGNNPKNYPKNSQSTNSTQSSASNETATNAKAVNTTTTKTTSKQSSSSGNQLDVATTTNNNNNNDASNNVDSDQETIEILSTLLELLDRHPLLALPRDSIYCLDYNCNELSTKNYLNLKIQHLENLIEQHRKFRYYIGERLKRSEQRYLDLTLKLELERSLKLENERSVYQNKGKITLLKHIDELKKNLEEEKANKHAIVMTLLNELLDERERNETLSARVIELERKLAGPTHNNMRPPTTKQQVTTPPGASQQSISKPRVPAKPAQLLDRQRSQTKK